MRKVLIVAVLLLAAGGLLAQGWKYALPNNSSTINYDSLICITTAPDTTVAFYFKDMNSHYANVFIEMIPKNASLSTLTMPLLDYKFIDGRGKLYGADSAASWKKLCDSSHLSLGSAGDTLRQYRTLGAVGSVAGIRFRGTGTAESTKVIIRVTAQK